MADPITLERIGELAAQLPPPEQLKLVARICERLSSTSFGISEAERSERQAQRERLQLAEELLAECEDVEDDSQGISDAAETIREMRGERIASICLRGV